MFEFDEDQRALLTLLAEVRRRADIAELALERWERGRHSTTVEDEHLARTLRSVLAGLRATAVGVANGGRRPGPATTDLGQVLAGTLDTLDDLAAAHDVRLRLKAPIPPVAVDTDRVGAILFHLVRHGLGQRFPPKSRPTIVVGAVARIGVELRLEITDNAEPPERAQSAAAVGPVEELGARVTRRRLSGGQNLTLCTLPWSVCCLPAGDASPPLPGLGLPLPGLS
jgi:hypothetical protein